MKTQISSAIFFALSFTTSCQAFVLKPDQAELDRRSETEGIKYRTYKCKSAYNSDGTGPGSR